jgi:hypothetical protein
VKLRHVQTVTTPDRLLFSTDYPFQQPTGDGITTFLDAFPAADRALFTTRTPLRCSVSTSDVRPEPAGPRGRCERLPDFRRTEAAAPWRRQDER